MWVQVVCVTVGVDSTRPDGTCCVVSTTNYITLYLMVTVLHDTEPYVARELYDSSVIIDAIR